jgi:hypothetical protein
MCATQVLTHDKYEHILYGVFDMSCDWNMCIQIFKIFNILKHACLNTWIHVDTMHPMLNTSYIDT